MKKIAAIIWKNFRVRFTSLTDWLFFLVLPVIFTLALSAVSFGSTDNRVRVLVVDQAQSPLSSALIDTLSQSGTVRVDLQPLDEAEDQFQAREAAAMLVIPAGFSQDNLQTGSLQLELRKQPNNTNALIAEQTVLALIHRTGAVVDIAENSTAQAEALRAFGSEADRQAWFASTLAQAQTLLADAPARISETWGSTPDQIDYHPAANTSAGQIVTWVFIPLFMISAVFTAERQTGTLRRIMVTPTRKAVYLLGILLGEMLAALLQMLILMVLGALVLKLDWGRDPAAVALIMLSSVLAAAALGTTLGAFVKTASQAQGLSIMLGMVMALLGGCWYPIELFPQVVRDAVKVLPTSWAMQGMLDILVRGKDFIGVLPVGGVLLAFAAVFFTIGIARFRYE